MKISSNRTEESSNSWLLISLLAIIYFLYEYMIMNTTTTMICTQFEDFWLTSNGYWPGPYIMFVIVFLLFGLWALVEVISVYVNRLSDRFTCTVICFSAVACIALVMLIFRAQWEHFEVKKGIRDYENLTFQLRTYYIYEGGRIDAPGFDKYLAAKICEDPINNRDRFYEYEEYNRLFEEYKNNKDLWVY